MITGIGAKRVEFVPAMVSKCDGSKTNILNMNITFESIEDIHVKDVHWQIGHALGNIETLILNKNTQLILLNLDRYRLAGLEH